MVLLYGNAADSEAITGEDNFVPDAAPYLQGTENYTVSPGVEENLVQQTPIIGGYSNQGGGNQGYDMGSSETGAIDDIPVRGVSNQGGGPVLGVNEGQTRIATPYLPPVAMGSPSVNINTPAAIPMGTPTMPTFGAAQALGASAPAPGGAPLNPIAPVPTGPNLSGGASGSGTNAMPSGNFNTPGPSASGGGASMYPPFQLGAQVNVGGPPPGAGAQQVASAQPTPVNPNPNPPIGGGGPVPPETPPNGGPSAQFASPISSALKAATPLVQGFHDMLDNVANTGGQALHDAMNTGANAVGAVAGAVGNAADKLFVQPTPAANIAPSEGGAAPAGTPAGTAGGAAQNTLPPTAGLPGSGPPPSAPHANSINNVKILRQVDEAKDAKLHTMLPDSLTLAKAAAQTGVKDATKLHDLLERATKNFFDGTPRDPKTGQPKPSVLSQIRAAVYAPLNIPSIPVSGKLPEAVQKDVDATIAAGAVSAAHAANTATQAGTPGAGQPAALPKTPPGMGGYELGKLDQFDPQHLAQQAIDNQGDFHRFSPRYYAKVYLPAQAAQLGQEQEEIKDKIKALEPTITAIETKRDNLDAQISAKNNFLTQGENASRSKLDEADYHSHAAANMPDKVHKMTPRIDNNGNVVRDANGRVQMDEAADPKTGQPIMIPNPDIQHAIPHAAYFQGPLQTMYSDLTPGGRSNKWQAGKAALAAAHDARAKELREQAAAWRAQAAQLKEDIAGLDAQKKTFMEEQKGVLDHQDALAKQSESLTKQRDDIGKQIKDYDAQEQYADLTVQQFQQEFQKNLLDQTNAILNEDKMMQTSQKLELMSFLAHDAIEQKNKSDILRAVKLSKTQGVQQNVAQLKAMQNTFNSFNTQLKQYSPQATLGRPLSLDQQKERDAIIQKQADIAREIIGVINSLPAASEFAPKQDGSESGVNPQQITNMLNVDQQPGGAQQ